MPETISSPFDHALFLERVENRRLELKIRSERALCIGAGLSANFIRNLRTRQAKAPNAGNLIALADHLRCSTDWLLGRDGIIPAVDLSDTVQPKGS